MVILRVKNPGVETSRLLARDTGPGLRELFEANSLADVYVKAMAS